ncbi:MAG: rod shape-determining protein RodA, partial [Aquabacterium sp.]|nr:rod shape-determining protein RodA [Aquabacterium sp.]
MNVAFARPSWWQRLAPIFQGFDLPFVGIIVFMCLLGLVNMYSVGFDHGTRFIEHGRNMMLGAMILFVVAQVPPQRLMALAVPLYTVGVVLLVATALFGITKKGATRWLNIGIVIQPSELIKIATPLMLAWWFQRREGQLRGLDYAAAGGLLLLPVGLVLKQPDLGTSLLVLSGGLYVIFFAGLSWRLILPVLIAGVVGISLIVGFQDTLCEGDKDWVVLHGYQKQRVCTLLNPTADPLGKGFHIIQGMIAIGSGGITGKGFMQGTQTHLEFIPERTTDFAFA